MKAPLSPVHNRGTPPQSFLNELVAWGCTAPDDIFAPNPNPKDIYSAVLTTLGPWTGLPHCRAVMLEVMRVHAGFESSWNWQEGVDRTNDRSMNNITSQETGAWQVSYDSRGHGEDLKRMSPTGAGDFIVRSKDDHPFAMEYYARLVRHNIRWAGPLIRHGSDSIYPWLRRDAVAELMEALS